jgi:hypothetical protein
MIKMYTGEPKSLLFEFKKNNNDLVGSNPFIEYNKDYADIEHTYFGLKINTTKDLDNKYLEKILSGNIGWDTINHTFVISLNQDDTENIIPKTYRIVLAVKLVGYDKRIELRVDEKIIINGDKSRN